MNKTLKRLISLTLAILMLFSMGFSSLALTTISAETAKALAMEGIVYEDLIYHKASELTRDQEGNEIYKVTTIVTFADGTYNKYTTDVGAEDGTIFNKTCELNVTILGEIFPDNNNGVYLSRDEALANAYKAFCITPTGVVITKLETTSVGNVVLSYDISFIRDYNTRYTCTVYAETGVVDNMTRYQPKDTNIVARLVMMFQVMIAMIKNMFNFSLV